MSEVAVSTHDRRVEFTADRGDERVDAVESRAHVPKFVGDSPAAVERSLPTVLSP